MYLSEKLSYHFNLKEFVRSDKARMNKIDNLPNEEEYKNIVRFTNEFLEPLRKKINTSITISSGYRSMQLNKLLGGATNSQHRFINDSGAVDIYAVGYSTPRLYEWIKNNIKPLDQLILEKPKTSINGWVHISYSFKNNRNEYLIYDGKSYKKG